METEEHKIAPKSTLAPIAEQEVADESPEKEPSSSLESSSNLPIVPRRKPKFRGGQPRMVRMRRKRREDPFGSLVQSTKRMRLNEGEVGDIFWFVNSKLSLKIALIKLGIQ